VLYLDDRRHSHASSQSNHSIRKQILTVIQSARGTRTRAPRRSLEITLQQLPQATTIKWAAGFYRMMSCQRNIWTRALHHTAHLLRTTPAANARTWALSRLIRSQHTTCMGHLKTPMTSGVLDINGSETPLIDRAKSSVWHGYAPVENISCQYASCVGRPDRCDSSVLGLVDSAGDPEPPFS
jgi:hypothetical protein